MAEPDETAETSTYQGLKDHSLKTAGYAYLLGDAALFASGAMAGRYKEASSGLLWGIGGLVCARYANPDAEKQLELLSGRLADYLHKQGVAIPREPDTALLLRDEGLLDQVEGFLHRYPSQVLNSVFTMGGIQLLRSGLQHGKGWDATSGALVTAGALAGLLVPEHKPDNAHPPEGAAGKAMAWLQDKPLRIPAIAFGLNNVALTVSAIKEMRANPAQKSYMFKFLTAASYVFGNVMMGMSSKSDHGNDATTTEAMRKLAQSAAHVIHAQAPELQEVLLQHIAGYLAAQPDVHMKAEAIAALLHEKMQEMAGKQGWRHRVHEGRAQAAGPSL